MPDSLDAIGSRWGTDKAAMHHNFLVFYERFLTGLRYRDGLRVLEIGVYGGASLRMWEEYFPYAVIVGLDVNPDARIHASSRCPVVIADQSDIPALARLVREHGPFDIIIDDGSHAWHHQIASFRYLYAGLLPGGYYIMEDLDTSYGSFVKDYKRFEGCSTAQYLHLLCDYIVGDRALDRESEPDEFIRSYAQITELMSYYRRTCVIQRKHEG